ncbi:hypothetical protein [Streptomyces sp. NPDC092307]|uniref:hypothetical protein n=1 Tax=Streptomyces sp. NPDC092307 TaxID=3366013 RepID=UPI0037F609B5
MRPPRLIGTSPGRDAVRRGQSAESGVSGRAARHAGLDTIAASGRGAAQCADHLRAVLVAFGTLPARDEQMTLRAG